MFTPAGAAQFWLQQDAYPNFQWESHDTWFLDTPANSATACDLMAWLLRKFIELATLFFEITGNDM